MLTRTVLIAASLAALSILSDRSPFQSPTWGDETPKVGSMLINFDERLEPELTSRRGVVRRPFPSETFLARHVAHVETCDLVGTSTVSDRVLQVSTEAVSLELTDTGIPDADAMQCMLLPNEGLNKATANSRNMFRIALQQALTSHQDNEKGSFDLAMAAVEKAETIIPNEPRIAYTKALILISHQRGNDSLAEFRRAASHSKPRFVPALQALAWADLRRGDNAAACKLLCELTDVIEEVRPWKDDGPSLEIAAWLGSVSGYLKHSAVRLDTDFTKKLTQEVELRLTGQRRDVFAKSQQQMVENLATIQSWLQLTTDQRVERRTSQLAEISSRIAKWELERDDANRQLKRLKGDSTGHGGLTKQELAERTQLIKTKQSATAALRMALSRGPNKTGEKITKSESDKEKVEKYATDGDRAEFRQKCVELRQALSAAEAALKEWNTTHLDRLEHLQDDAEIQTKRDYADLTVRRLRLQESKLRDLSLSDDGIAQYLRDVRTHLPFHVDLESWRLLGSLKLDPQKVLRETE